MENEKKLYLIKIGKETKRGNFLEDIIFGCKSEKPYNNIVNYYRKKYKGYDVVVSAIEDIDTPEIKDGNDKIEPEPKTETIQHWRLKIGVSKTDMSKDLTERWSVLRGKKNQLRNDGIDFLNDLRREVNIKFKTIGECGESDRISVDDFLNLPEYSSIEFDLKLKKSLEETTKTILKSK